MGERSNRDESRWTTFLVVLVCGALLVPLAEPADAQFVELSDAAGEATAAVAVTLRPHTITVLPFSNISGETDDEWIGTGIAETLTADLQLFAGLSVVGREAFLDPLSQSDERAPTLTEKALARDVALDLGVAWIVAGGYQRLGDQIRVTAWIVNVETGAFSKAVKVDGQLDQLFDLQDRIAYELSDGFAAIAGTSASAPAVGRLTRPQTRPNSENVSAWTASLGRWDREAVVRV